MYMYIYIYIYIYISACGGGVRSSGIPAGPVSPCGPRVPAGGKRVGECVCVCVGGGVACVCAETYNRLSDSAFLCCLDGRERGAGESGGGIGAVCVCVCARAHRRRRAGPWRPAERAEKKAIK